MMIYLLALLIVFCAIGIIMKYRAYVRALMAPSYYPEYPHDERLSPKVKVRIFVVCIFLLILGYRFVDNTYFDFLALTVLMMILIQVWLLALAGEILIPGGVSISLFGNKDKFHPVNFLILFISIILGLLIFSFFLTYDVEKIRGLLVGPQFATGIVQEKSSNSDRSGVFYYVDVNDEHYHVPEGNWWRALNKGDEIQYAYNPAAKEYPDIFQLDRITFTISGLLFIVLALIFWSLTFWVVADGYRNWFFPNGSKS